MGARNIASVLSSVAVAVWPTQGLRQRRSRASHSEAATEDFASRLGCSYDGCVLEPEVYAARLRDLNKIVET